MDERSAGIPASTLELSESEQRLLDAVRAGLVDAEIAVRLGISNGEVKARIERLAAKLGVAGRAGLRTQPRSSKSVVKTPTSSSALRPRYLAVLPVAIAAGLVVVFLAGVVTGRQTRSDAPTLVSASVPVPLQSAAVPTPNPEVEPVQEFNDVRMQYAGQLLSSPNGNPFLVTDFDDREGLSAVWLIDSGFVNLGTDVVQWRPMEDGTILAGQMGDRRFELHLFAGDHTRLIAGDRQIALYSTSLADKQPLLLLFAVGPGDRRHSVHVDFRGRLFIASSPLPPSTVIESATGEALPVVNEIPSFKLTVGDTVGWVLTQCREREACAVSHYPYPGGLTAPFSGRVTCPDIGFPAPDGPEARAPGDQVLTLTNERVVLSFWRFVMTRADGPPPGSICNGRDTAVAGEQILPAGQYVISARSPSGEPMDVVAGLDGTLFVGQVEPRKVCPCLGSR